MDFGSVHRRVAGIPWDRARYSCAISWRTSLGVHSTAERMDTPDSRWPEGRCALVQARAVRHCLCRPSICSARWRLLGRHKNLRILQSQRSTNRISRRSSDEWRFTDGLIAAAAGRVLLVVLAYALRPGAAW